MKAQQIEKAQQVLSIVNWASFWIPLGLLQAILRPLAIATNVSQAANTRLDHVLLTLGNLYRIYSSADKQATGLTDDVHSCILSSLERRWGNAEQKPFILALFFNPWIQAKLFSAESSFNTPNRLFGIIKEVWARIYPNEQRTSQLLKDMQDYFHRRGIFSDNRMNLKDHEENSALEDVPVNMIDVWTGVDTGENQFIQLAIRLLSIVANSAGCERFFSQLGGIHTKDHNRLGHKTARNTAVVASDLHRSHVANGLTRKSLKRKHMLDAQLGDSDGRSEVIGGTVLDEIAGEVLGEVSEGEVNFDACASELIREATSDDTTEDSSDEEDSAPSGSAGNGTSAIVAPPTRLFLFLSAASKTPLSKLFNFEVSGDVTKARQFSMFWKGGLQTLREEAALYDLLSADDMQGLLPSGLSENDAILIDA